MYRQFNIQQFYVLPTQWIYVFCVDLRTAIISLYSINWLVCITETESVYCAVRTGSLYIIHVMCFVWIWEQAEIFSLYSINRLVCITETVCVYCAVRTESLYIIQVMCFVWIWEQAEIFSLYSINWLVCVTETECVYCAVGTGSLYIIQQRVKQTFCWSQCTLLLCVNATHLL